jgi:hypothetical protein
MQTDPEGFAEHLRAGINDAVVRMQQEMRAELAAIKLQSAAAAEPAKSPKGPKPPKPSYYDGSTDAIALNRWLNQMEDYLAFYQYPDGSFEPAKVASFYLSSHARTWWSQMNPNQKATLTWWDFVGQLKARFYPIDHERQVLSRIEKLRQRGPVAKFIEAFESLRAQVSLSDSTVKRYFINGLRSDLKVKAVEYLLDNPECHLSHLYQRMTAIGEVLWESRMIMRDPNAMDLSAISKQTNRKPVANAKKRVGRDKSQIVCYGCNRKGHYRNECPSKSVNALTAEEGF